MRPDTSWSDYEAVLAENAALRERVAELEQRTAELQVRITELGQQSAGSQQRVAELEAALKAALEQLEAARRAGKRQAAPFSKGPPKDNPKPPGRKPGHPPAHREKPNQVDRTLEVRLPHATCLKCGGELVEQTIQVQYQVEIPPVKPIVTQFNVESARCAQCGERFQARSPEQTSDALGAAAVQIGPRALGLAAELKHGLGVPYRKVGHVLDEALGLTVAPGTLARAGQRLAAKAEPTYQLLVSTLRQEPMVNADETGWKIGGRGAWLWVFASEGLTVYTIDHRRSHEVAERILGKDFSGILTCDCFLAYDPLPYRQHKCTGHFLRRCSELQADKQGAAAVLSLRVARLLRGAMKLRERQARLGEERYKRACEKLEAALDRLLAEEQSDSDNARLVKLLKKHRSRVLTFLYVEGLEPTNNLGEREIRPEVVVRKISGGNRGDRGARAHAILGSVIRTCQRQGRDFLGLAVELLRSRVPKALTLVKSAPKARSGESVLGTAQPSGP